MSGCRGFQRFCAVGADDHLNVRPWTNDQRPPPPRSRPGPQVLIPTHRPRLLQGIIRASANCSFFSAAGLWPNCARMASHQTRKRCATLEGIETEQTLKYAFLLNKTGGGCGGFGGAPGRDRTGNLQLRRLTLYPIELQALDREAHRGKTLLRRKRHNTRPEPALQAKPE